MAAPHEATRIGDYLMILKPRLSALVLLTTVVGYYFGSVGTMNIPRLIELLFGTALVAMGSGALNQVIERHSDKLMKRTADRPLPAGRLGYTQLLLFGVAVSIPGLLYISTRVNETAPVCAPP